MSTVIAMIKSILSQIYLLIKFAFTTPKSGIIEKYDDLIWPIRFGEVFVFIAGKV